MTTLRNAEIALTELHGDASRRGDDWALRRTTALRLALAYPPSPDYVRGQERMRERAAARAGAEEELDGPMPGGVHYALARDPEAVLRGLVRATKNGIASGIRSLPLEDAALDPISEPKCRCGIMVKDAANWNHRADCPTAPAPSPSPAPEAKGTP